MESALTETLTFTLILLSIFFLPGALFVHFLLKRELLSFFDKTIVSFGLSLGLLDLVMLFLARAGIALSPLPILSALALGSLALIGVGYTFSFFRKKEGVIVVPAAHTNFTFSKREGLLFLFLLLSTVFIKTLYLKDAILPTATDLGHHMYWSKIITETKKLPVYAKSDIIVDEEGQARVSAPRPIADFIVGEHLPFAAIATLSGLDYLSAFPINFLSLINLLAVLASVSLAWRIGSLLEEKHPSLSGEKIALVTFLLVGPLYALASPQAKFVSGGVVGNTLGNFLIPVILLFFLRALAEKKASFLGLAIFFSFILAYTHHLSVFVLFFLLAGSGIALLAFHWKNLGGIFRVWFSLLLKQEVLLLLAFIAITIVFFGLPSYLDKEAIDSAIGTPTKTTRTGLSFLQATNTVGMAKMAVGLSGLILLLTLPWRRNYGSALLLGWGAMLLVMSLFPGLLLIDIPSNRIGSYLVFPLALFGGLATTALFSFLQEKNRPSSRELPLPSLFSSLLFVTVFTFVIANGFFENSQTIGNRSRGSEAVETFAGSRYLQKHAKADDVVLKDHNYIVADSWMKLFFLRDYSYPLSRGFFSRYAEGGSRHEQCTLAMISIPNTLQGKECYEDTGVNLVVVNPHFDATQFEKSPSFSRLYASDALHIYARH
ncbi:MAG: hypothetical protein ABI747_02635 [Candidatus Moraniibacteriota bacterium]